MTTLKLTHWIEKDPTIDDPEIRKALLGAVSSRGHRKGKIKKSAPPFLTDPYLAWQAIMLTVNSARFSQFAIAQAINCMRDRVLFQTLVNWARRPINRVALNVLGARPFEFNMWDHSNDREDAHALIVAYYETTDRKSDNLRVRKCVAEIKLRHEIERQTETETETYIDPNQLTLPHTKKPETTKGQI